MEDKRFTHIATDPKFRRYPKTGKKVHIDQRFQGMFKGKQFKTNCKIDSRGRPINHTSTEDLKRYYHLSSEESSAEEESGSSSEEEQNESLSGEEEEQNESLSEEEEEDQKEISRNENASSDSDEERSFQKNDNGVEISDTIKIKLRNLQVDYARGESNLVSESSSDDESDTETSDNEIEHRWGELDADAERTDDITYRLAACNMDWDRIRALDLMVLFNSFVPDGGVIKSVVIYPSEFGRERLKDEDTKGPTELVKSRNNDVAADEENEEGSKYHMEKLRQYQLNRLKYYYAVVTCDGPKTANKIYSECDGMEYESSATKIDLRFIPDDMVFNEEPKEVCNKMPETTKYEPRFFTTTALQQAKVNLTWDETDPERIQMMKKVNSGKMKDIDENDIKAYLGSGSEDEDEDKEETDDEQFKNDNPIGKYRALLNEIDSKEKEKENSKIDMEISWQTDLQEKTDKLIKKKMDNENKTPFQQYLEKRKDKRREKREERKKEKEGDSDNAEDSDVPSGIDMNDPYFAEEFDKDEFKSKKKRKAVNPDESTDDQNEAELELLLMNNDDKKHFNLNKIQDQENESKSKKKRKKKEVENKVDDFEINVDDPRFSALYTSHHFNIDPTDPRYKKTKGTEKLINEKLKRRNDAVQQESKKPKLNKRKDAELNVLVKSVKRKVHDFVNKKT